MLSKEIGGAFNLYFFDQKTKTFESSNKNEEAVEYEEVVKKYISFGFYTPVKNTKETV